MFVRTRVKPALSLKQVSVTPVSNLTPVIHTSLTPVLTLQKATNIHGWTKLNYLTNLKTALKCF